MGPAISTQVVFDQDLGGTVPLRRPPSLPRSHAAGHDTGDPPPTAGQKSSFCASHMLGCAPWRKITLGLCGMVTTGALFGNPPATGKKTGRTEGWKAPRLDGASSGEFGLALIDQRALALHKRIPRRIPPTNRWGLSVLSCLGNISSLQGI